MTATQVTIKVEVEDRDYEIDSMADGYTINPDEQEAASLMARQSPAWIKEEENTMSIMIKVELDATESTEKSSDSSINFSTLQNLSDKVNVVGDNPVAKTRNKRWKKIPTGDITIGCKSCGETFDNKEELDRHMSSHRVNKKTCISSDVSGLKKHHGSKKNNSKPGLRRQTVKQTANLKCRDCSSVFDKEDDLMVHLEAHKRFTCKYCPAKFRRSRELRQHSLTHPKLVCKFCSQKFLTRPELHSHLLIHKGEKRFKCQICPKEYPTNTSLARHMRAHRGDKPFVCDICGRQYFAKNMLVIHLRRHTGERPFVCKICGKKFADKDALTRHIQMHTGEKPYGCRFCSKRYIQKVSLDYHVLTHTGEKPFACDKCPQKFMLKQTLQHHQQTHAKQI